MRVEGFGIPEGYGYYGMAQGVTMIATGYVGPAWNQVPNNIPTAGTAVEIDSAKLMRIENVHISDGGMGPGNAAFQCGLDESDPTNAIGGDVANIVFTDSRLDSNPLFFAGASNSDVALRLGNSCHDSVYRNITAYDGAKADVMLHNGNLFGQIHVGSSAVNTAAPNGGLPLITWGTIGATFGLAGVADYGVYATGNTSLSQTRCDIADTACVLISVAYRQGSHNPAQITDTQVGCGAFTSVPSGYGGVQMTANSTAVTVSGTAVAGRCGMPPAQLVSLLQGGPLDPTSSLCNNSNAPVAACTGFQGGFAKAQFYTQPAVSYGTVALAGGTLYAVPFFSPAGGGTITQFALQVTTHGTVGSLCDVGLYSAFAGRPNSLIVDGGTVSVASNKAVTTTTIFAVPLAPGTQYYLAVGCNGTVTVEGLTGTGAVTVPLTGAKDYTSTNTQLTAGWTFAAGGLPPTFGTITAVAGGSVPNVYVGP